MSHLVSDYNDLLNVGAFTGKGEPPPNGANAKPPKAMTPWEMQLATLPDIKEKLRTFAQGFQSVLVIVLGAILLIVAVALITR